MLRLVSVVVGLSALVACEPPEVACTDLAATSVALTVTDAGGAAIPGVIATYSAANASGDCSEFPESEWVCGYEVAGDITIHVEAPGYLPHDEVVNVASDECHVISESLAVVLEPVVCNAQEVPSAQVTVSDAFDATLTGVSVTWAFHGSDMSPEPCDFVSAGLQESPSELWTCTWSGTAAVDIYAVAIDHEGQTQTVTVLEGECGPDTADVEFILSSFLD